MSIREVLNNKLKEIQNYEEKNLNIISKLNITTDNPDFISNSILSIRKNITAEELKLREIGNLLPSSSYQLVPEVDSASGVMSYIESKNIYKVILNELLPHRPYVNQSTNYLFNKNIVYSGYRRIVEDYEKENCIKTYNEKITVYFKNIYNKNSEVTDHDNLEQKIFIDAVINKVFIIDDSPEHLQYFMDFAYGYYNHTEVLIGEFENVLEFLNLS